MPTCFVENILLSLQKAKGHHLSSRLFFSFFWILWMEHHSLRVQFWRQQRARKIWSKDRPNLPWLTLKKVCPGLNQTAEVSPSLRHLAGEHHGESVSSGQLWNRGTRKHFYEKRRERRCDAAVQNLLSRWEKGLCVAAWATLRDAHRSPLDSHFQKASTKKKNTKAIHSVFFHPPRLISRFLNYHLEPEHVNHNQHFQFL